MTHFAQIWAADFEFHCPPGHRPTPLCMVARELNTGATIRLAGDELRERRTAPYDTGPSSLFLSYYASAELGCFLALNWPLPDRVLDLYVEFRNLTNGLPLPAGNGLLGALAYFGLDTLGAAEKESMRDLAQRGEPFTAEEWRALVEYCETDVAGLHRLFDAMRPKLDIPRAVLRGRFMRAAARMERTGTPVDAALLELLKANWENIQGALVRQIDRDFGVYEERRFSANRFAAWLAARGIPWPRLPSGALALDYDNFKNMSMLHPELILLKELRASLAEMRLSDLAVGPDGRNRTLLSPFRARTGRNQPSNSKFVFGPAVWVRHLIRPEAGTGLAYVDWEQQEFGIGAALSGDKNMMEAYASGDPYLTFAKQAHAAPATATRITHAEVREVFKTGTLGIQYGMEAASLAARIERPTVEAQDLLRAHHQTYSRFWKWSDAAVDYAMIHGHLSTVFGWRIFIGPDVNPRGLRNFPMQANGAEMLRLACSLATEQGVAVCAPVHDAVLIEAPLESFDEAVATMQTLMVEASRLVLGGFELRTEVRQFRHPEGFRDKRGTAMWGTVQGILRDLEGAASARCH